MSLRHLLRPRHAIVSRLQGGLGNQMFQYAAGRAAAWAAGCALVLDTRFLQRPGPSTPRTYALDAWQVEAGVDSLPRWRLKGCRTLREPSGGFDARVLTAVRPGDALEGYWQSERYFEGIRATLLQEFQLRQPASAANQAWAERIRAAQNATSLHFRRGDYVTLEAAAQTHGVCSIEYYRAALSQLNAEGSTPQVFVFSDEPDWVRAEVDLGLPFELVDSRASPAAEDIWLMSLCANHIVANSSFSWWGAWLSTSAGRTFAPKHWFRDPALPDQDIVPSRWHRL